MRLAWRSAALAIALIASLPLHYLWKVLRLPSIWPQIFLACAARCIGLRIRVEGVALQSHVLFVANHVTWLDILVLGSASRASFVARGDLAAWPLIGWIARLNGTVFVDRQSRRQVHGQADLIRSALSSGGAVALFPEGTTHLEMQPFRPSLFASLYPVMKRVKVQPVAIDYGELIREVAWVDDEPAGRHAARILSRPGTIPVRLAFLESIDPQAAGDRKALAAIAQLETGQALGAFGPRSDPL